VSFADSRKVSPAAARAVLTHPAHTAMSAARTTTG
jgi:hypothetical protein